MSGAAPQIRKLTTPAQLRGHLASLGVGLPIAEHEDVAALLGAPHDARLGTDDPAEEVTLTNRFCILPMEGWDATADGRPTELVERRWQRFGSSGAALVWGGEAVAVRPDGRANPRQLCIGPSSVGDLTGLREVLLRGHHDRHPEVPPPLVGLQLTHSGRFARPDGTPSPRLAYRHPLLDERVGVDDDRAVLTDGELDDLVADVVAAAVVASRAGFAFVDVKACHGYLGHELLSAVDRPGPYGGDLDGRLRFLRLAIEGIRRDAPDLGVAVRLSAFDLLPHRPGSDGLGEPEHWDGPYPYAFGGDGSGHGIDLGEVHEVLARLTVLGVGLVCITAGSPYYNPHVQRPAYFPPSDGYTPPEDPLVGVARLIRATAEITARHPDLTIVGSGYSYLQEWLPAVAAGVVATGGAQLVGMGRMVLSYPELPADVLAGRALRTRQLCRTFSDCTTAPRNGIVSGCFPLDPRYRDMTERSVVVAAKRAMPGRPARAGHPTAG